MDYTSSSIVLKIRKAVRYVRLYGVGHTRAKIKSQSHMRRRYETLPPQRGQRSGRHVGLLGCGNFGFSNIAHFLRENFGDVLRGTMDIDIHRAASLFEEYDADYYTDDAEKIISDPAIDLIFIASNHASHADYAVRALRNGKSVHIEKPHAVNLDELRALCRAMQESTGRVTLGFNRPASVLTRELQKELALHQGTPIFNWFVVGHYIGPDHWYMKPAEGGRVVGNLCHWTDFLLHFVPPDARYPIRITPARANVADNDIVVSYVFGDNTVASITFTGKGHTFEGVRERLSGQRGDAIFTLTDFQTLEVEVIEKRSTKRLLHRDQGHEETVRRSYALVRPRDGAINPGATAGYVWETGNLYLQTKRALEEQRVLTIESTAIP